MKKWEDFKFTKDNYLILAEHKIYTRTASGKSWKSKPDTIEHDIYTAEQYTNFVTAAPWFNRFFAYDFDGNRTKARCTISCGYTSAGYLPTGSTNTSPTGDKKRVTSLEILNKDRLLAAAGYRERNILNNAITWNYRFENGYEIFGFETRDGSTAEYSMKLNRWTN